MSETNKRTIQRLESACIATKIAVAIGDELRAWWRFTGSQQPTSSYHEREDFIKRLPKMLIENAELAALREENERLKRSIDSFGNGNDFDWSVLAKVDQLEQENERLRKDCRRLEYLTSIAHVTVTADDQLILRVDLQLDRNVTTIEKLDGMTTDEAIRHFADQSIRDWETLSATSGESEGE